jgi:hypothetical protein
MGTGAPYFLPNVISLCKVGGRELQQTTYNNANQCGPVDRRRSTSNVRLQVQNSALKATLFNIAAQHYQVAFI